MKNVIFFAYEGYDGDIYPSWDKCRQEYKDGYFPYLTGYLYNSYCNCTERIDEMECRQRPTISEVKKFMKNCYKILEG